MCAVLEAAGTVGADAIGARGNVGRLGDVEEERVQSLRRSAKLAFQDAYPVGR
jgi:hypothetical protein